MAALLLPPPPGLVSSTGIPAERGLAPHRAPPRPPVPSVADFQGAECGKSPSEPHGCHNSTTASTTASTHASGDSTLDHGSSGSQNSGDSNHDHASSQQPLEQEPPELDDDDKFVHVPLEEALQLGTATTLILWGIPEEWGADEVLELFEDVGCKQQVNYLYLPRCSRDGKTGKTKRSNNPEYGFVNFDNTAAASKAVRSLHGNLIGGSKISLRRAATQGVAANLTRFRSVRSGRREPLRERSWPWVRIHGELESVSPCHAVEALGLGHEIGDLLQAWHLRPWSAKAGGGEPTPWVEGSKKGREPLCRRQQPERQRRDRHKQPKAPFADWARPEGFSKFHPARRVDWETQGRSDERHGDPRRRLDEDHGFFYERTANFDPRYGRKRDPRDCREYPPPLPMPQSSHWNVRENLRERAVKDRDCRTFPGGAGFPWDARACRAPEDGRTHGDGNFGRMAPGREPEWKFVSPEEALQFHRDEMERHRHAFERLSALAAMPRGVQPGDI